MTTSSIVRALLFWLFFRVSAAQYSLIIDAGSSGSRLRLFHATPDGPVALRPSPTDESRFETEPGLSSFVGWPEGAGPSLKGLLDVAKAYIPPLARPTSKLWVKATAGMRRLPPRDAERIFQAVEAYLREPGNCPFELVSPSILPGEQEAVFGYLGINSLLGTGERDSVGMLDMGGASMQVAFKPDSDVLDGEFDFYAGEHRESIYARSFIQFGLDTALHRAHEFAASSLAPGDRTLPFPCYLRGYSEELTIGGRRLNVTGTGDSDACGRLTHSLLHHEYECLLPPCAFMGVHMPRVEPGKKFYALSNFFYVPNGLGILGWNEERAVRPADIAAATDTFCARTMNEARAGSDSPMKYLRRFCFGGHYVLNVLQAMGFSDDSESVTCLRKLQNDYVDWTYGAALYETLDMPSSRASPWAPSPTPALPSAPGPARVEGRSGLGQTSGEMWAPSILGLPGWGLWICLLSCVSLGGWLLRSLPLNWREKFDELPELPMSPVALLQGGMSPPRVFRAVSAPMLQPYKDLMGRGSRSNERKVTWANSPSPKAGGLASPTSN